MMFRIHNDYINYKSQLLEIFQQYDTKGTLLVKGKRNTIKIFKEDTLEINVKKFKKPNIINQIIYKFFRKSKAKRSFEYANRLLENGILTPQPIAFAEQHSVFGLKESFYACKHLNYHLTYRELVEQPNYPDHENILRQFTRFSFDLHEKGIEFKDHSPGNTLIVKKDDNYDFYLVDLNRMNFHTAMNFDLRMKNLCRLTPKKEMVQIMANEYAKYYKEKTEEEIFNLLWTKTSDFQKKFHRKQQLKKKFK